MRHALVALALGAALAAPATAQTYTNGKIDDLPKAAWNLLNFSAVDLYTVEDNVDRMCGKNEYAGSGLFPGAIIVGNPDRFGRVRIT